ncbi:oligosaccharide flippase family protein [Sulfuracidifex metallicus]|uniref:Oligosaccharide flippase family protein n=1 Tax=Sulfuracidifex metallicus DSM 6482 = JCM 9184 TaxID=523847 RepID=A0A6A9QIJ3_SULME|nr:oligosaccharide flippase family protein [Sulfuracidifex metallicus]MUN28494.1 oligosaccharide flippase family protein [Sulfuracidifex metallicus DSM 6482 = JCM 9184]WOE50974.1 oligosaccharide flippase family protein [Sulfuracidifex metallicus DSM 6482 = JCM 9184]
MGDISKYAITSYLHILVGTFSAMVLLGLNTIIIARLLGPANYGLYTLSFGIPYFLLGFIDLGMTTAAQRYISEFMTKGKLAGAKKVFQITSSYMLTLSLVFTVLFLILSNYIASTILNRPELAIYLRISALVILLETVFRYISYNQLLALGKSHVSSFIDFLHALLRFILAPLLIILGFGIAGAIFGVLAGYAVAGIVGITYLLYIFRGIKAEGDISLKSIFSYNIPFTILGIIGLISSEVQYILLSRLIIASDIGNYVAANNLTSIIAIFTSPLAQITLPTFSRITDERPYAEAVMKYSKYALLITLGAQGMLFSVSFPLVYLLYGKYSLAPYLLQLSLTLSILTSFLSLYGRNTIFYIKRMYKIPIVENIINISVFIPLSYFLLLHYGIVGMIFSVWGSSIVTTIYEDIQLSKLIRLKLKKSIFTLIRIETIALISLILPTIIEFKIPYPYNLPLSLVTFITQYIILIALLKTISTIEINEIESALENSKFNIILKPLLKLILIISSLRV